MIDKNGIEFGSYFPMSSEVRKVFASANVTRSSSDFTDDPRLLVFRELSMTPKISAVLQRLGHSWVEIDLVSDQLKISTPHRDVFFYSLEAENTDILCMAWQLSLEKKGRRLQS